MNGIDLFLVQYGLAAIFVILLVKTIGVPIPIPSDLIILTAAARAAQGKLVLWQALIAILIALVLGGLIQFVLTRGPGRGLLYRFGRYIGLTAPRLDAASGKVKKGGVVGISLAILVPGVRGAAIAASGLANMPLRTFLPGLVVGSALFPMSLLAGYYTTRASLAWVPVDHDERKILAYLEKFYRVARRYSGLKFDYVRVAVLELQYFDVHRQLSGNPEKGEFLQTLVDLHSAIFGLSPEQVRESAEWRLLAANTVDLITSKTSTDVEGDWVKLKEYLRRCYRSIQRELKNRKAN